MAVNIAEIYKNSKEQTASKEEIITMLYDGAIKFCNIAITELELKNMENVNTNIKKVQRIIEELILTLDMRYPVSQEFKQVYEYILELLLQANMKKDKELLERACNEIRGMRDTWVEVVKKAKSGQ
ncbi:MAG: flagellar export chaperone FliS [Lachnospiraceae bacterium]|nr:flagellar export chaperone FliS [Lachnospiraceae bacterium]